ncbi:MAG: hypothetical protein MZV64_33190 [Ignavibacteriales bacterium]|nr:hypothetical protein [Ignavibacteriales bacterium]
MLIEEMKLDDKYKKLVEAKPDDKNIRYNYGVLLLGADDFEGAETQFIKAIEIRSCI